MLKTTNSPAPSPRPLLMKPADAAKALCICPRHLWTITQEGGLPCVRIGRAVRYDPRDLQAWIDRQKQAGPAEGAVPPDSP